jgi:AraC-like DNA-binding protein
MKPKLEQLGHQAGNRSFLCYRVTVPYFELLWHYHPEYELTYILKGRGKRLVGDEYQAFEAGDFVLLPPLMPHTWISDQPVDGPSSAIVIQFPEAFAAQLLEFPELKSLEKLFARAGRGLHFTVPKTGEILPLLQKMPEANEVARFGQLLQVLQKLSHRKATPIASVSYKPLKGKENQQRISKVFQYVQQSFHEEISLGKAAGLVHLSDSAFCKFFKRASGKTFSDYVNEIRIGHACQLLLETDRSVRNIAIASGFESMTYFNRVFLRKKKLRPVQFRAQY